MSALSVRIYLDFSHLACLVGHLRTMASYRPARETMQRTKSASPSSLDWVVEQLGMVGGMDEATVDRYET